MHAWQVHSKNIIGWTSRFLCLYNPQPLRPRYPAMIINVRQETKSHGAIRSRAFLRRFKEAQPKRQHAESSAAIRSENLRSPFSPQRVTEP